MLVVPTNNISAWHGNVANRHSIFRAAALWIVPIVLVVRGTKLQWGALPNKKYLVTPHNLLLPLRCQNSRPVKTS